MQELPAHITIERGDMLVLRASGAFVESGEDFLQMLGPFQSCFVHVTGRVLMPMGVPDTVMFLASETGDAQLSIISGDPWGDTSTTRLSVTVK